MESLDDSSDNVSVSISDTSAIFIGDKAHSKQKIKISELKTQIMETHTSDDMALARLPYLQSIQFKPKKDVGPTI